MRWPRSVLVGVRVSRRFWKGSESSEGDAWTTPGGSPLPIGVVVHDPRHCPKRLPQRLERDGAECQPDSVRHLLRGGERMSGGYGDALLQQRLGDGIGTRFLWQWQPDEVRGGMPDEMQMPQDLGHDALAYCGVTPLFRLQRATVPSSIQPQAMAVIVVGVCQVVARIVRSSLGIKACGAQTWPTRRPVATLLERLDTYTVNSGADAANGGGASAARKAYAASSITINPCCRAMATRSRRRRALMTQPSGLCSVGMV